VPPATVRRGAFIARMPCSCELRHIVLLDSGTIGTWATAGPAHRSQNVHLSRVARRVLDPASAPHIEDGCFIGARSEMSSVYVEFSAVISMGCHRQSTRITIGRDEILYGACPRRVVVRDMPAANGSTARCAVIVKRVDGQTRPKTSLKRVLRHPD